jgi:hypothetical protein
VGTTSDAIRFKDEIRNIAKETARAGGTVRTDPEGWREYVSAVIGALQRGGGAR